MAKKKKILITGGLGHIGARLIRELELSSVGEIIILDNLDSRRYPSLYDLPSKNVKYQFVNDDILTADFDKYLKGISVVVHLAAITDAEMSYLREKEVEAVNYMGLQRVADACLKSRIKLFFPSTTSIYGSQASRVDETCKELKPQSPYAWTKLLSEKYLQKLGKKGLKFVICRFGTIFGHSIGMRFDTAVNKFTWQAVNDQPLTVWKTAWNQKRPYLYLGDCIRAINFIIKNNLFNNEVYNVLTANFTVEDVVRTIKKFIPKLEVQYVNSPIMNQLSYEVDDSKFRKFGFKPIGDFRDGIAEAVFKLEAIIKKT